MSRVQIRNRDGSGYYVLLDGQDLSAVVFGVEVSIRSHDAVVKLAIPATELDMDLQHVDVVREDWTTPDE